MEVGDWSKIRMGKNLPPNFVKGRSKVDGQFYVGNISYKSDNLPPTSKRYIKVGEFLEVVDDSRRP